MLPQTLRATLEADGEIVLALKNKSMALVMAGDWVWHNHRLQPLGLPPALKDLWLAPVRVTRAQVPPFLSRDWPQLSAAGGLAANFKPEDFSLEPQVPRFLLALKGGLTQLSALLQCAYGSRIMTVGVTAADEAVWLPDPGSPTRYSTRDASAERTVFATNGGRWRVQMTTARCGRMSGVGDPESMALSLYRPIGLLGALARPPKRVWIAYARRVMSCAPPDNPEAASQIAEHAGLRMEPSDSA